VVRDLERTGTITKKELHIYIYAYTYINRHIYIFIFTYINMCIHIYIYIQILMHVYTGVWSWEDGHYQQEGAPRNHAAARERYLWGSLYTSVLTYCNTLQHSAIRKSSAKFYVASGAISLRSIAYIRINTRSNTLQHAAMHCKKKEL